MIYMAKAVWMLFGGDLFNGNTMKYHSVLIAMALLKGLFCVFLCLSLDFENNPAAIP